MSNTTTVKSGAWREDASDCRSAYLADWPLAARADDTGFRLALTTDSVQPRRTTKGGSWFSLVGCKIRSARRNHDKPDFRSRLFGLRLALTASIEP